MEISKRVIDRPGSPSLRKESVQASLISHAIIELKGYLLADNTGVHNVAVMNRNEERLDSTILLAMDCACKDDSNTGISTGCRRRHVPADHKSKGSDKIQLKIHLLCSPFTRCI
jgi:hypothetical protein